MPFHNPFIKDGLITFPEGSSVVKHVEKWAKVRGDGLAYRFLDFSVERDGVARDLLWAEFSARNKAVGARLQQVTEPGDRIAILCPQNLEYLIAFFGTLYGGRIAVPLFDPSEPGHVGRLHAVLDDCHPAAILTTTAAAEGVRKFFRSRPAKDRPRVIAVDAVPEEVAATWVMPDVADTDMAYLQYTSGSTRIPTGVEISHLSLATNVVQVIEALEGEEGDRGVTWLPFFHDMGLVTALLAPMFGYYATFMTPAAFVRRPERWIREMARKEGDTGGAISVAPNFAFDHAAARGVPKDGDAPLDLSNVKAVLNGSEPISAATVRRFNEAFGPYGFPAKAIKPSYGLAEATVFVTTGRWSDTSPATHFDTGELAEGRVRRCAAGAGTALVAYDVPQSPLLRIVDSDTHRECPDDEVGEIWVYGDNVAAGYWRKPPEDQQCFGATLSQPSSGIPAGPWLRTGDLGFVSGGRLFIVGRIKDLLIIRGRNHYPEDIEATVQHITGGRVAAIAVPEGSTEQLVAVIELKERTDPGWLAGVRDEVTAAISNAYGLSAGDLVLVASGSIPTTTSGKIRRAACVEQYQLGRFTRLDDRDSQSGEAGGQ